MRPSSASAIEHRFPAEGEGPLARRLCRLHEDLLARVPDVDRIACALYQPGDDLLRTHVHSTRRGRPIVDYAARLQDVPSLQRLARLRQFRVIDDIPQEIGTGSVHSRWLLDQGYRSSFTVPLHDSGQVMGFVFYNSMQTGAFDPQRQQDLILYSSLINIALVAQPADAPSIVAAAQIAREFTGLRDFEVGAHQDRMARVAQLIARDMAPARGLTDRYVEQVYLFSRLHDIGKIGIPNSVLYRAGPLDAAERAKMEGHVGNGLGIVDMILDTLGMQGSEDAAILREIVGGHHEYLDGTGYPLGLKAPEIPLASRIATVADIFDALTSIRPYKRAWTPDEAFAELERLVAQGKLDGDCVAALQRNRADADRIVQETAPA